MRGAAAMAPGPMARAARPAAHVCLALRLLALAAAAVDDEVPPPVGYGSANVFDASTIATALSMGYKMIDTAALYHNQKQVGEALQQSAVDRKSVYLVTKVGFWPRTIFDPILRLLSSAGVLAPGTENFLLSTKGSEARALKKAKEELQVERIDLCLVHSPITSITEFLVSFVPHRLGRFGGLKRWPRWLQSPTRALLRALDGVLGGAPEHRRQAREEAWRVLEQAQDDGLCREIGVSNYGVDLLEELKEYATRPPLVNEVEAHPRYWPVDVMEYCRKHGIYLIGYGNGVALDADSSSAENPISEIARRLHKSASQVALRWAIQHHVTVIPKSTSAERMRENLQLFDFTLTEADMARLDGLNEQAPFYWDSTVLPTHTKRSASKGPAADEL